MARVFRSGFNFLTKDKEWKSRAGMIGCNSKATGSGIGGFVKIILEVYWDFN
jgi:hypothetical protein